MHFSESDSHEKKTLAEAFIELRGGDSLSKEIRRWRGVVPMDRVAEKPLAFDDAVRLESEIYCLTRAREGVLSISVEWPERKETILLFSDESCIRLDSLSLGIHSTFDFDELQSARAIHLGPQLGLNPVSFSRLTSEVGALTRGDFGCGTKFFAELCLRKSREFLFSSSPSISAGKPSFS